MSAVAADYGSALLPQHARLLAAMHPALATKDTHDRVRETPPELLAAAGIRWPVFPEARGSTVWVNPTRVTHGAGRDGDTFIHFAGTFQLIIMPPERVVAAFNEHLRGWSAAIAGGPVAARPAAAVG